MTEGMTTYPDVISLPAHDSKAVQKTSSEIPGLLMIEFAHECLAVQSTTLFQAFATIFVKKQLLVPPHEILQSASNVGRLCLPRHALSPKHAID